MLPNMFDVANTTGKQDHILFVFGALSLYWIHDIHIISSWLFVFTIKSTKLQGSAKCVLGSSRVSKWDSNAYEHRILEILGPYVLFWIWWPTHCNFILIFFCLSIDNYLITSPGIVKGMYEETFSPQQLFLVPNSSCF